MRVVLASSGGTGHFNPLRPVADTLVRRGDEVLVVVPPDLTETVEATGLPHRIGAAPPDAELAQVMRSLATMPPAEAGRAFRREVFGRLCTAAMLPTLDEVCEQWRPDLVLREPAEFASAIAARRHGVPQARIAISLATASTRATTAAMPSLLPYGDQLADELHASPYLTRLPAALDPSPFPVTHRFREPAEPPGGPLPDWWNGQDTPLVYVTFGSVTGGFDDAAAVYRAALEAVADLPVRVLLTVGRDMDAAALGSVPANVHVKAWVPQTEVLTQAAVVVCHGGSGTTYGTLAAGVPLVIVPLFADQPDNAHRVAEVGAGLAVEPEPGRAGQRAGGLISGAGNLDSSRIRAAISSVLAEPSYREAAGRIARDMRALPTLDEVLDTLVSTLARR